MTDKKKIILEAVEKLTDTYRKEELFLGKDSEESGEGGDAAHHGHDAENDQALRHEYGLTLGDGLLVRLVEIHEPVGDDAGKQRPPELADRKRPHFGDGEISDG